MKQSSRRRERSESLDRKVEEKWKKRQDWMLQQKREREHERLKRQKIEEFERKLAQDRRKRRSSPRSKSKSPKPIIPVMSKKTESSSGTKRIFQGPEGTRISVNELSQIKVDIKRNLPGKQTSKELERGIVNPEDITLIRREGEGKKPLYAREEFKNLDVNVESSRLEDLRTRCNSFIIFPIFLGNINLLPESITQRTSMASTNREGSKPIFQREDISRVEEQRTVVSTLTDKNSDENKSISRRSVSHSPTRHKQREVYRRSRHDESYRRTRHDNDGDRRRETRGYSRDRERRKSKDRQDEHRSRSKERNRPRSYREFDYRPKSMDHSTRDRRDREIPSTSYVEQIPVPVFYNFPPRPFMFAPMVPLHGGMPPMRGRYNGPARPYQARFLPPNVYRNLPNIRFGPMF